MSFVIYNKDTTIILRKHWYDTPYATETGAKAALTRQVKKDKLIREDYAISEVEQFYQNIERKVTRYNMMSKEPFTIGVNEPACVDPSTGTYWSC